MINRFWEIARRMTATGSTNRKVVNRGYRMVRTGSVVLDKRQRMGKRGGAVATRHAQLVDRSNQGPRPGHR